MLDPLKMKDTTFHVQGEAMARFARPASNDPDLWVFDWLDVTKAPKRFSGGAGMASTAGDYYRLLQMLMNGGALDGVRLLSPMTVRWAMANHIGTMRGTAHPGDGYSWNLFNPVRVARRRRALPRQHRRHLLGRHHRPALFRRSERAADRHRVHAGAVAARRLPRRAAHDGVRGHRRQEPRVARLPRDHTVDPGAAAT